MMRDSLKKQRRRKMSVFSYLKGLAATLLDLLTARSSSTTLLPAMKHSLCRSDKADYFCLIVCSILNV